MNAVLNTHLKIARLAKEGEFTPEEFEEFLEDVMYERWNGNGMKAMRCVLLRHEIDVLISTVQQHYVASLQEFLDSFACASAA